MVIFKIQILRFENRATRFHQAIMLDCYRSLIVLKILKFIWRITIQDDKDVAQSVKIS